MTEPTTGAAGGAPTSATSPPAGTAAGVPPTPTGTSAPDQGVDNPDAKRYADEAASWRVKAQGLQRELDRAKAASQTDAEKALAAAKAEGASEYQSKYARVLAENAALAILSERQVTMTDLAIRGLDLTNVDVDLTKGTVDRAAVIRAVDDLLTRYPQLVPNGAPPIGSVSGGDQPRVQAGQVVRPTGKLEGKALDDLVRYALGNE